ncbi:MULTISPECIES: hypothetical protein [unclassified Streptomyces]|uniref:hypothetical protein n=1 Tax=unclassified Streptomyces TaxID=2593676 RepID=UPI0012FE8AA1|nr:MULTISPECIES: hypothetical protein [unclassified Streptomyces]
MSGPDDGRTHARMLWASVLALFLEGALALALGVVFGDAGQAEPGEERVSALTLLFLPFLPLMALLPALVVSAVIVLPTVLLGEDLARRFGGRPLGWQLLLSAAAGALVLPLTGRQGWPLAAACLSAATLLTRPARRGYFVSLLVWGALVVLTVFTLGGIGVYAGLIGD